MIPAPKKTLDTQQVTQQVIQLLRVISGEMARVEIMAKLSLNDRVNF